MKFMEDWLNDNDGGKAPKYSEKERVLFHCSFFYRKFTCTVLR
jgi:hypothetical protein